MYLLVLLLPILNMVFSMILGRFLGNYILRFFQFNMFLLFLISILVFYEVGLCGSVCYLDIGEWFHTGLLKLNWVFLFDSITVVMLLLVIFISFLVHLYSIDYMRGDPHITRFLGYLSLFTFFMLMLVTSGTFIQMFLGWEGVGLSSYLLINFWFTRVQANKSAMKAILVNRFGDFGIYFAILIIFFFFRSFDFSIIFVLIHFLNVELFTFFNFIISLADLICLFLFIGSIGKSAQIGLHTWLPDAMEGPTPVSALIHAATMVTAGVFVLIRCSPIFEYSDSGLFLITLFGALTALFAGTLGLVQNDIKKVIAYSTCSQLGYMFLVCGLSNYSTGLFHLFNHGFFKALLFLGAGSVIHAVSDEQDMRKMGGLLKLLPITYCVILVGSLCLTGFPFLSGFYSKEAVLELAFLEFSLGGLFFYWLGIFATFITSFYSVRLIYLVFLSTNNSTYRTSFSFGESNSYMCYVISLLGFLSIFTGFIFKDIFYGLGSFFWNNSIFQSYLNSSILSAEFLDFRFKLIPLIFSFFGIAVSSSFFIILYPTFTYLFFNNFIVFSGIYSFLIKRWYFDLIYNNVFSYGLLKFFYLIPFKLIDRGIIELVGPLSIVRFLNEMSLTVSGMQTGFIYNYIFIIFLGIILLFFLTFWIINFDNLSLVGSFVVIFIFLTIKKWV